MMYFVLRQNFTKAYVYCVCEIQGLYVLVLLQVLEMVSDDASVFIPQEQTISLVISIATIFLPIFLIL